MSDTETGKPDNGNHDKMRQAVRMRERRQKQWEKEGERALWRNLSMAGALGWLIVTPTLLGVLVGRWLGHTFKSGIFYTGAFICLGVAIGGYLAWQRINKE